MFFISESHEESHGITEKENPSPTEKAASIKKDSLLENPILLSQEQLKSEKCVFEKSAVAPIKTKHGRSLLTEMLKKEELNNNSSNKLQRKKKMGDSTSTSASQGLRASLVQKQIHTQQTQQTRQMSSTTICHPIILEVSDSVRKNLIHDWEPILKQKNLNNSRSQTYEEVLYPPTYQSLCKGW